MTTISKLSGNYLNFFSKMAWPDVESKKVEYIEAESRMLVIRGREMGEMGRFWLEYKHAGM